MKIVFSGFARYMLNFYLMYIPFHFIRHFILKSFLFKFIGKNCYISMGVYFKGKNRRISLGENCVINYRVLMDSRGGEIIIGDNVDISQEVNMWTLEHDPNDDLHSVKGGNIIIEDYVWVSTRVTILPGVRIGKGAIIASNCVVTKDVPSMCIMGGVPGKIIGYRSNSLKYNLNNNLWFT
ncbi:maltose O-acetyltransferase [Rhabdobacter roseus]|uniref:Maltose O-acetyltransferase n=1 Tax=Rhabdobacter roseus TaxID=1655419 RepID=A0A840TWB3_9BACT|nr:acyltransferase [Rhabdobacter roseus]MBB5284240.1 maltose O-acetyltransferase [Rhabdobacter roseus]